MQNVTILFHDRDVSNKNEAFKMTKIKKLIDLDNKRIDKWDDADKLFNKFTFKNAKMIFINNGKTYGIFEHADDFNNTYAIQYDAEKRPLYLAYGWENGLQCLESLYEIKHSFKELESVVKFVYDK